MRGMSGREVLPILLICLAAGCEATGTPSVSGSSQETTVKGTVTIKGKPAAKVDVSFDPANVNRPDAPASRSQTDEAGNYTMKGLVGENTVTIQGNLIVKSGLNMNRKSVTLNSGENTVDIEVTKWGMPGS